MAVVHEAPEECRMVDDRVEELEGLLAALRDAASADLITSIRAWAAYHRVTPPTLERFREVVEGHHEEPREHEVKILALADAIKRTDEVL